MINLRSPKSKRLKKYLMIYQGHMWSVYSELQEWKQEMETVCLQAFKVLTNVST